MRNSNNRVCDLHTGISYFLITNEERKTFSKEEYPGHKMILGNRRGCAEDAALDIRVIIEDHKHIEAAYIVKDDLGAFIGCVYCCYTATEREEFYKAWASKGIMSIVGKANTRENVIKELKNLRKDGTGEYYIIGEGDGKYRLILHY